MERDNGLEIASVVDANRAAKATPHEQLIDELMDSTIPKTEHREQTAAIEIEKNKDRIAAGHRLALELECLLLDTQRPANGKSLVGQRH